MYRSLKTQVLAGQLVLTALLTLAIGLGVFHVSADILERKEREKVRLVSQGLARETLQAIVQVEGLLERMAMGPELERFADTNNFHLLQSLFGRYRDSFVAIDYVNPQGVREYAASGPGYTDQTANLAADQILADALNAPDRIVSGLRFPQHGDGPLLVMALARRSPLGRNMGALLTATPLSRVAHNVLDLRLEQGGYAMLAEAWGTLVARRERAGAQPLLDKGTRLAAALAEGRDGVIREPLGGEDSLIGLASVGRHGLTTLVVLPRSAAIEGEIRTLRRTILGIAGVAALGAGLIALWWSRSVSRPLAGLTEAAQAVSDGDLATQAPETGPGETRALARSFNAMTAALAQSRDQLEQAKENLENILANMNEALVVVDGEGRVAMINRSGRAMLGYAQGEIEGRPVTDLFPPDEPLAAFMVSEGAQGLLAGGGMAGLEKVFVAKSGRETPVLVSLALLRGPGQAARGVVCLAMDITERKRIEGLTRARRSAESVSRAKTEFLAVLSHEMRTPLNIVLGILDHLLESTLTPQNRQGVILAMRSGHSLLEVITAMLDYAGLEAGRVILRRQPFEPRRLAAEVAGRHVETAKAKGLTLSWGVGETVPEVLIGDPERLGQALSNLLSNAVRFSAVGEARLVLDDVTQDRTGPRRRLLATVSDTGMGVTDAKLEYVFEPFTQEDASSTRRFGGLGLGLAITRRLVALMEGALCLDSRPGEGTDVYLSLAVEAGEAPALTTGEAPN